MSVCGTHADDSQWSGCRRGGFQDISPEIHVQCFIPVFPNQVSFEVSHRPLEETFPFTREKWALLDEETLKEGRTTEEEGGTYISHFTVNEPAHKEFEAGYDESEPSLRVVFELTDGKWYVTDCYNDWYNFDLPINELEETIQAVQEENKAFEELHP